MRDIYDENILGLRILENLGIRFVMKEDDVPVFTLGLITVNSQSIGTLYRGMRSLRQKQNFLL